MLRIAAVLALAASGCSVALQKRPESRGSTATSSCSTTSAYWIAESAGVAAGAGGLAFALANQDSDAKMAAGYAAAFAGIVYLASAVNGMRWARECRSQHESIPVAAR